MRAAFSVVFFSAWRGLLDPHRLDATTPGWLVVSEALVSRHHATSARLAASYYADHRAAELSALGRDADPLSAKVFGAARDHQPNRDAVRTSLLVCGPSAIRKASRDGRSPEEAAAVAAIRCEAAASRHMLTGGRTTTSRLVTADPVAVGWARVVDGDPCWWCAMLASRGPVYKSKHAALYLTSDLDKYHDGCGCTTEPTYAKGAPWPGDGRDWQTLWKTATENLSGDTARKAFRQAVDDQTGRTPDARRQARAAEDTKRRAAMGQEPLPDTRNDDQAPAPVAVPPTESAPAPEDWSRLSEDELYDRFAELSADPNTPHDTLAAVMAEMEHRDEHHGDDVDQHHADPAPTSAETLAATDLASLTDDEVFSLWRDHADDPDAVAILSRELERRDNETTADAVKAPSVVAEAAPTPVDAWPDTVPEDWSHLDAELSPEQQRVEELVSRGWAYRDAYAEVHDVDAEDLDRQDRNALVDADRRTGETRDQAVRRMYDEWVYLQYLAAEDAVRGHMLTHEGESTGIDALSLFSGPAARARRWASEDLQRWWVDNPRQTFTEYRAMVLGRDSDREAAAATRLGSNGRDFI